MARRRRSEPESDYEEYESDWGEEEYGESDSDSDSDSSSDSDPESNRTADLSDSDSESNSSLQSDDINLDIENIQNDLAFLQVPLRDFPSNPHSRSSRLNQHENPRTRRHPRKNYRERRLSDLTASSDEESSSEQIPSSPPAQRNRINVNSSPRQPTEIIEISSDSSSDSDTEDVAATHLHTSPVLARNRAESLDGGIWSVPESPVLNKRRQKRRLDRIVLSDEELSGPDENLRYQSPASKPRNPRSTAKSAFIHKSPHPSTFHDRKQFVELEKHSFQNHQLAAGVTVERKGISANKERSVFRISRLLRHKEDRTIFVEGGRYVFTSTLSHTEDGPIGHRNEVTAVIAECNKNSAPLIGLELFPISEVMRTWNLNLISPSQRDTDFGASDLFCKSKLFLRYRNREEWENRQTKIQGRLRLLKPEETTDSTPASINPRAAHRAVQIAEKYTFIDCCASIGGASEAAELAGLEVTHAIERDKNRVCIYKANFIHTNVHVEDFQNLSPEFKLAVLICDILHFSMTCRYWSAAKTTPGREDEKNRALLHEIPNLIDRIRPRQVTIEQVPGLIQIRKHQGDFNKLIFAILDLGYSIAWKLIKLETLGGNARRERLFILAAAPGEALPPWPKATHGPGRGLKPFVTAREALQGLKLPYLSKPDLRKPPPPFDLCKPDELFPVTLVRQRHPQIQKNGKNCKLLHWEGRPFRYEELARFQNLKQDRYWNDKATECAEMIGDAVPAGPFSQILKEVVKTLKETDGGNRTISRSDYDKPYQLIPSKFPRSLAQRTDDSSDVNLERLLSRNSTPTAAGPLPNVSRKRSAPTQSHNQPQKKQRRPWSTFDFQDQI